MSDTILGWGNLIQSAMLSAGSAVPSLPVENIADDIGSPSTAWQTLAGVVAAADGASFVAAPHAGASAWRALGLFRTNLTRAARVTFSLYANPSTLVWSGAGSAVAPGYGQTIAILPADTVADWLRVDIDDPSNPDGFVNVPLAFAGAAWLPSRGPTWATTFGRDSQTDEAVSRGGQEFPIARWSRRRWDIALDSIGSDEVWADAQELDRVSRGGGNVLFVPNAGSAAIGTEAVFGRVESVSDVSFVSGIANVHAWRFRIRERL